MSNYVIIHCQPIVEDSLINSQLSWSYNNDQDVSEIEVIAKNVDTLNDDELCSHYGINYDQVNSIELI